MTSSRGFISLGLILLLVIGLAILGGAGWYVSKKDSTTNTTSQDTQSHISVVDMTPQGDGKLPIIKYELTGTPPSPPVIMYLDLVNVNNAHSFEISSKPQFGTNTVDLDTIVPRNDFSPGRYALRLIYSVPGGTIENDTALEAMSAEFTLPL